MDQTKTKKKKPIGIVILIVAIILIIIGISLKPKNEAKTESKKNSNNNNETTTSTEKVDYKEYTEKYPQEKRNIDYYYNIYTPAFNKQRYNGKISLFGKIVDGPLTTQTLNNNNITYSKNHASMTTITDENTENEYRGIDLFIDGIKYPKSDYSPSVYIINETTGELYFDQSTTNQGTEDIIVPYLGNIDLNNLTVDDIINTLGVPTYVGERKTKLENTKTGLFGTLTYSYVYDFGDDTFEFGIIYSESTGNNFTNFIYRGKDTFNGKMSKRDLSTKEYSYYNSYKDYYEEQYKAYQEALKK